MMERRGWCSDAMGGDGEWSLVGRVMERGGWCGGDGERRVV